MKKPTTDKEKMNLILSGKVQLVNLSNLNEIENGGIKVVKAHFCYVDFLGYKADPSSNPMFNNLVRSPSCVKTMFAYDLKEIVKLATAMDRSDVHAIEPSGFIFHESRCGSTLVANALTAMDPEQHRVYSESPPPLQAMMICGLTGEKCPPHQAAELFQDVVYMMGRTRESKEKKLFFKIQSMGIKYIDVVMEAFPNTPWIFVYRDPVQIMMSQLALGIRRAVCIRQLALHLPVSTNTFLTSIGRNMKDLSPVEKCAVQLSTLCNAAIAAITRSKGMGIGVNYENLVNKLIDDVIPNHLNALMTEEGRQRIIDISGHYSKGKGKRKRDWKEDSERKEEKATPEIREACDTFLYQSFNTLEYRENKRNI